MSQRARPGPLAREGWALLSAVQFATLLPVPDPGWEPGRLARAAAWFPLAGALVGGIAGAVYALAHPWLGAGIAAGLALAAMLRLTGALHEDGLADLADATGGATTSRERALEIMRDSRLGTFGVLALGVTLGLRWLALAGLATLDGLVALMLAAAIGRAAMLALAARLDPAREAGLGAGLAGADGDERVARSFAPRATVACVLTALAALALAGLSGLAAIVAAGLAALWVGRLAQRRLGGATGDVYGAAAAVAETAALVAFAGALG